MIKINSIVEGVKLLENNPQILNNILISDEESEVNIIINGNIFAIANITFRPTYVQGIFEVESFIPGSEVGIDGLYIIQKDESIQDKTKEILLSI